MCGWQVHSNTYCTYLPTYVCVAVLVGTGLWVTSVISNALRLCQCATNSNAGSVSLGGLECVAVFVSCPCRNEKHDIPLLVETCVHEVERRGESRPLHVRTYHHTVPFRAVHVFATLL